MMGFRKVVLSGCLILGNLLSAGLLCQASFKKTAYLALRSEDQDKIISALHKVETSKGKDSDAFRGALLMKQAAKLRDPSEKIRMFKEGRDLLERSISAQEQNVEYKFLRLMIQEHAPKILNYDDQIKNDCTTLVAGYKNLDPELQDEVILYSKNSKQLNPEKLKKDHE